MTVTANDRVTALTTQRRRSATHSGTHAPTCIYIYDSSRSRAIIVQELCESRGGRPELSVLTSLLVSVDVN